MVDNAAVIPAFLVQVEWCRSLGSPFTAALLTILIGDLEAGGPTAALVGDWPGDPQADALPLRLAGALHAMALDGSAPDLAACYPPQSLAGDADRLRAVLDRTLRERAGTIRAFLASPPQTNEVGRSAILLGGFLQIAAETGLPLRLLEIGASAGLNMIWDRYSYRLGSAHWGDPASPLLLAPAWQGPTPPLGAPISIASRAACDRAPIDLERDADRLRLRAYIWADQLDRLARLDAAIALARATGVTVARADAGEWVGDQLSQPVAGCVSVLYHSIMWTYLPPSTRSAIEAAVAEAGARATTAAPVAWLRFEPAPPDNDLALQLTLWPGGRSHRLASASAHGQAVTWTAAGPGSMHERPGLA